MLVGFLAAFMTMSCNKYGRWLSTWQLQSSLYTSLCSLLRASNEPQADAYLFVFGSLTQYNNADHNNFFLNLALIRRFVSEKHFLSMLLNVASALQHLSLFLASLIKKYQQPGIIIGNNSFALVVTLVKPLFLDRGPHEKLMNLVLTSFQQDTDMHFISVSVCS